MYLRQKTMYHRKNHVSSEKLRKLHCICFHSSSMLHNTLEWKSNVNFQCSTKWQFQGYYFHTNNVENITLAEQKKKNVSEELSVTELTVKSYWIMLGRTWKSAKMTLAEQKKIRYWRVQNNFESHLRRKLCAVKPTILSKKRLVLSIFLSRFSNTQSILLTSNFSPLCGTLVNFFDSYNLILSLNTFYWPLPDLCCACY